MAGIVIVGAGICGVSAAFAAREAGFDGRITLIGDDPEWPYERPPLSKWEATEPRLKPLMRNDLYVAQGIDLLRATTVTGIDRLARHITLATGQTLPFSQLLLATGASPRRLPPHALPTVRPSYLRSYADAQKLAQQIREGTDVLIIGGGFIGLELAASLAQRKAFVHVVEAQDRILARALPRAISDRVHDLHMARGVTIHTAATVDCVRDGVATLSTGDSVRTEHVIVGIGSVPNTALAEDAGLAVDDGIVVDARFATQVPEIFAAGDCCTGPVAGGGRFRFESWQVAGDQGRFAGQSMAGLAPDRAPPAWFWSDQFDHSLQVVGVPGEGGTEVLRAMPKGGIISIHTGADGKIASAAGFGIGNTVGRDIKILQKLIDAGMSTDPATLSDPDISLKTILRPR